MFYIKFGLNKKEAVPPACDTSRDLIVGIKHPALPVQGVCTACWGDAGIPSYISV